MFSVGDKVQIIKHETLQGRTGTIKGAYTDGDNGRRWDVDVDGRGRYVLYEYRLTKLDKDWSPVIDKIRKMAERQTWKSLQS